MSKASIIFCVDAADLSVEISGLPSKINEFCTLDEQQEDDRARHGADNIVSWASGSNMSYINPNLSCATNKENLCSLQSA